MKTGRLTPDKDGATQAKTATNHPYRDATITIDESWMDDASNDRLEDTLVHELVHVHYAPIEDQLTTNQLETIVDWTALMLLDLARKGLP